MHAVQMISLDVIYACGEDGTFMRSYDGGQTWDVRSDIVGSAETYYSMSFIDEYYGMCCSDGGRIIKTIDGGSTWDTLSTKTTENLNSILVVDKNIAMAISPGDQTLHGSGILRTTDGGNNWITVPIEGNYASFSIKMFRPDFITITGYAGTILKSVDTGRSWHYIPTPYGNTYFNVHFSDDTTITVVGDLGFIIHTTNGGVSWTQGELADSTYLTGSLNVVDGKDPNILSIVGDYGVVISTTDGGTTWNRIEIGTLDHIKGLSYFDKLNATAVGRDGVVLRTTDGGQSWFYLPHVPETYTLYSIAFPKGDTSNGIAVGYYGTIMRTTNGGNKWIDVPNITDHTLRSICFIDSVSAIAVGDYGAIFKTADIGVTWTLQPSGTGNDLNQVSFATPNDGLIVGDNVILRTYLAGEFWTPEYLPSADTDDFYSVGFPDPKHAFIAGYLGFYASNDGGVNWDIYYRIDPSSRYSIPYSNISFADSLYGAIATSGGEVSFTHDAGHTWFGGYAAGGRFPSGVYCIDRNHTTVVGYGGYIGHTTDGGLTWHDQQSNTLNYLRGVCFGTVQAGTAVGSRGNIMRITTDEKPESAVRDQGASGMLKIIFNGNYPNPFSGGTTITYHLPTSGFTTVEIFSVDGKLLSTIADEFESSGEHSIRFDAANLSSGTYICRVSCNGMSAEGKLKIEN